MDTLDLKLVGSGNSYLVLRHKCKRISFGDSHEYLLKLSRRRENSLTTKFKLLFLEKINRFFSKLPYFYKLIRHFFTIDSHEAIRIRSVFGAYEMNFLPQIRWKEHCFYEENALSYISSSKNDFNLIFELKIKCGLNDFVGFPNLFLLRKGMSKDIFDPSRLLSLVDIQDQVALLLKEGKNSKYLKVYINGKQALIENNKYKDLVNIISDSLIKSKELIDGLLFLQSYGSGQQFIAHTLYMLLDIYFKIHGQITDSWKIYYLQWLRRLDMPAYNTNIVQIEHFNGN